MTALAAPGCGSDDEDEPAVARTTTAPDVPGREPTGTTPVEEPPDTQPQPRETPPPATSPEDVPGGAGDEQPIRVDAAFTCRESTVTPPKVAVVPFIAIRVLLRSPGGSRCRLEIEGRTLRVGPSRSSATTRFDGLRTGERYTGSVTTESGGAERVEILSSAEPGP